MKNGCAWCETPAKDPKTLPITGVPASEDQVEKGKSWFCPVCKIPYATIQGFDPDLWRSNART